MSSRKRCKMTTVAPPGVDSTSKADSTNHSTNPNEQNEEELSSTGRNILAILDNDALRCVLVWTRASDHHNIYRTCRLFRNVLDEQIFLFDRIKGGHVEVHSTLLTPRQLCYKQNPSETDEMGEENVWAEYQDDFNDLGSVDEEGVTRVEADIWVDSRRGGHIELALVEVDPVMGGFHYRCDVHSDQLVRVGTDFFDDYGNPRIRSIMALPEAISRNEVGNFCYIEHFGLKSKVLKAAVAAESFKVAAHALRSLLCDTRLRDQWYFATYFASPAAYTRNVEDKINQHDVRPFLQAGFCHAKELEPYSLFAVPSIVAKDEKSMMTSSEVLLVDLGQVGHGDEPKGEDAKLLEFVMISCGTRKDLANELRTATEQANREKAARTLELLDDSVKSKVSDYVEAGASVIKSNSLHCCAANFSVEYFRMLIKLLPESEKLAAINLLDNNGMTPLMTCASLVDPNHMEECIKMYKALVELGADQEIKDAKGKIAVSYWKEGLRKCRDYYVALTIPIPYDHERMYNIFNIRS